MGGRWLSRLSFAAAAGALALLVATPGWADSSVDINPGNVPTTAAAFSDHNCDDNFGGGPYAGSDVWVFVLPDPNTSGVFTSVTATFTTPSGSQTFTIPSNGVDGAIVNLANATSKAWIKLPAGYTLTGATATITGEADFFNLTHTCPSSGSPSPSPSGSQSGSPSPSPSGSESNSPSPSPSTSVSTSPSTPGGSNSPSPSPAPKLPVTGAPLAMILGFGAVLLAAGAALLVLRRRGIKFTS